MFAVLRQRGRLAGFSLYVSNSDVLSDDDIKDINLCYKDKPQLPPLNFTALCLKQGRYVIYYNQRLDDATYSTEYEVDNVFTELCEVKVQGKYLQKKNQNTPIFYILESTYKWKLLIYKKKFCLYEKIV